MIPETGNPRASEVETAHATRPRTDEFRPHDYKATVTFSGRRRRSYPVECLRLTL